MKNLKRFVALMMATTMVVGSGFTAMAAEGDTPAQSNAGGASGTGDYEGYVEETSVFSVDVPTDASATKGFNFFVDPNGLLAKTDYARITGATAADFETGSTLFFERTPKTADGSNPAVVKYGKDSETITFKNMSSYDVNVEVSATISGAEKITLGEAKNDATDPTIELAIVSGSEKKVITDNGATLTGTIAGDKTNFKVQYKDGKYQYALKDTNDVDESLWKTYSFNLSGACSGTWTDAQAEVEPTVNLTWKVTDPKATPADDYIMSVADNGDISYTFGAKPSGDVTGLTIKGTDRMAAYTGGNVTYDAATGVLTVKSTAATKTGLATGGNLVITIGGTEYTLTYTK